MMPLLLSTPIGWDEDLYFKEVEKHIARGWEVVKQYESGGRIITQLQTNNEDEVKKYADDTY